MTGQIPKYGKHFRRESVPYSPTMANRAYVLKADPAWIIQSDKTSGIWQVYLENPTGPGNITISTPLPTLGLAMIRLLEGIDRGFYALTARNEAAAAEAAWAVDPANIPDENSPANRDLRD